MTTRYFEYAVSEGEGTLVAHGCYRSPVFSSWVPLSMMTDKRRTMTRGCQSRISEAMADGGLSPEECRSLLIDIGKHSDTINSMRALVEKAAEAR